MERALTVLSNKQDDGLFEGVECDHNRLGKCCLPACKSKTIDQLNEGGRLRKHPTEFRVHQPFEPNKFKFTSVGQEEVLFRFKGGAGDKARYFEKALVSADGPTGVLAINVGPMEHGHHDHERLPQRIDPESFFPALRMAATAGTPCFSALLRSTPSAILAWNHWKPKVVWEMSGHIMLKRRKDDDDDGYASEASSSDKEARSYGFEDRNVDGRTEHSFHWLQYIFGKVLWFFSGRKNNCGCRETHPAGVC